MTPLFLRHASSGRIVRHLAALICLPLLAACSFPQEVRGNLPDLDAIPQLEAGKTTKDDVQRLLGSPTSISTFDPDTWYYVSRKVERDSFSDPNLIEQRVFQLHFDKNAVLTSFEQRINETRDIDMAKRTTPAPGRELSFIEQLIGDFGRVSPSSDAKKK